MTAVTRIILRVTCRRNIAGKLITRAHKCMPRTVPLTVEKRMYTLLECPSFVWHSGLRHIGHLMRRTKDTESTFPREGWTNCCIPGEDITMSQRGCCLC